MDGKKLRVVSPKIRQILLHWGYELTEKNFFSWVVKLTYENKLLLVYRQEILQKAKERYSKEKAAEYYAQSKEAIKEKSTERYKNLSQ